MGKREGRGWTKVGREGGESVCAGVRACARVFLLACTCLRACMRAYAYITQQASPEAHLNTYITIYYNNADRFSRQ